MWIRQFPSHLPGSEDRCVGSSNPRLTRRDPTFMENASEVRRNSRRLSQRRMHREGRPCAFFIKANTHKLSGGVIAHGVLTEEDAVRPKDRGGSIDTTTCICVRGWHQAENDERRSDEDQVEGWSNQAPTRQHAKEDTLRVPRQGQSKDRPPRGTRHLGKGRWCFRVV